MIPVLDTMAGVSLLLVGFLGWRRFRRTAVFALAATATWFVVPMAPYLVFLHRPLVAHAILALPRKRVESVLPRALLVVAWGGVALPLAAQPWVASAMAVLCVAEAARLRASGGTGRRPEVVATIRALVLLAVGLTLPILERLVWPDETQDWLPLASYLSAVTLACLAMIAGILSPARHETDAVIELSDRTPARAFAELRATSAASSDPRSNQALTFALALLQQNAELQLALGERIDEVRASRSRLIGAATDERRRLEQILADGALRHLDALEESLGAVCDGSVVKAAVHDCLAEVVRTRDDLEQLARGLHPRTLAQEGLAPAIAELCRRSPVPVEVSVPAGRFSERAETTMWYACAEALANVWKHAKATTASVHLTEAPDVLQATIHDDGVGGASLSPGGGLNGLVDRVSDVGGRLSVTSSSMGTEVIITVPLP
jgi:signal transduction histidine kinase